MARYLEVDADGIATVDGIRRLDVDARQVIDATRRSIGDESRHWPADA